MLRCIRRLLFASLIASAAGASHAAELGDPRVSSHIGQQLVADIELTLIEDPNTPVGVRLASPEVYSEAGIAVPPVLASLNLSVMRRDGRQFLHATTLRPVEADHLHLYLELSEHGQRVVRLATLWLTPDPNPAPAALPAPAPAVAAAVAAPAAAPVAVARAPVPVPVPVPARPRVRVEAEPAPPALAWAKAPTHAAPAVRSAPPVPQPAPLPLPVPAPAPAHPAACVPHSGEAEACAALGAKNAELRARINVLEQRVTGLQTRLGAEPGKPAGKAATVVTAPASKATPASAEPQAQSQKQAAPAAQAPQPGPPKAPPGPMPISAIKPLVPHKPAAAPPDEELPWAKIGGGLAGLAAVAGGGAALVRARRRRARNVDIPAEPGVLPRLRERFFTRNGGKDPADPGGEPMAEPTLE